MTGPGINYTSSSLNRAKRARNLSKKELPTYPSVAPGYAPSQPRPLFAYLAPPPLGWDVGEDETDETDGGIHVGKDGAAGKEGRGGGEGEGGAESENGGETADGRFPNNNRTSSKPQRNNPTPAGSKPILSKRTFDFGFSWAKPTPEGGPGPTGGELAHTLSGERLYEMGGMGGLKAEEAQRVSAPWWMTWRGDELSKTHTVPEPRHGAKTHRKRLASTPKPSTQQGTKRPRRPATPAPPRRPPGTPDPDLESSQSSTSSSPDRRYSTKPPPTHTRSQSSLHSLNE